MKVQLYAMLDVPPYTIFLLTGLTVHDQASPTAMILQNVSLATSGKYKCEISGGPPRFPTDETLTEVQVVGEPAGLSWTDEIKTKHFRFTEIWTKYPGGCLQARIISITILMLTVTLYIVSP